MSQLPPTTIHFSQKVLSQIQHSLAEANRDFEVGGLLLGYHLQNCFSVVAATVSSPCPSDSAVSFTLDGPFHTKQALKLLHQFQNKPELLGVWHSHLCDAAVFSEQDRQSNRHLAADFDGILSVIVVPLPQQHIHLNAYYIYPNGEEAVCDVVVAEAKNFEKEEN